MEVDTYEEGVPSWVDLGTSDIDAAARFYAALFGWEAPELPPEAGDYRVCTLRGRPVAGLGPQMNPGPPVWATYLNTADAGPAAARRRDPGVRGMEDWRAPGGWDAAQATDDPRRGPRLLGRVLRRSRC